VAGLAGAAGQNHVYVWEDFPKLLVFGYAVHVVVMAFAGFEVGDIPRRVFPSFTS
jgi:hypothetical protein